MLEPTPVTPPTMSAGGNKGLIDRAKDLLMKPREEWAVIDNEPATVSGLFTSYVMILAAIPAIATMLCLFLFVPHGVTVYGVYIGISTTSIVVGAVLQYVLGLASVYIIAMIIDALAPSFGSTKDQMKAMKVAAYYPTAYWLLAVLLIIPGIGLLGSLVGGIYSLYLLYLGLPILMKTPQDKVLGYFIVTLIVAIVVLGVIGAICNRIVYGGMF
jgi:Yip1 domain